MSSLKASRPVRSSSSLRKSSPPCRRRWVTVPRLPCSPTADRVVTSSNVAWRRSRLKKLSNPARMSQDDAFKEVLAASPIWLARRHLRRRLEPTCWCRGAADSHLRYMTETRQALENSGELGSSSNSTRNVPLPSELLSALRGDPGVHVFVRPGRSRVDAAA